MEKILEGLNEQQLQAVTHKDGPLLIIAGAGTGKTSVITRRIAWLVNEGLAKTEDILALTFTDKAAHEMQERIDLLLPYGYTDIWVSTFHAFGDRILRENAYIFGLNPDFKVLTLTEAAVFFREHLFEFNLSYFRPLSEPTRFIKEMISYFSRLKDEDVSPEEYTKFAKAALIKAKDSPDDEATLEEAQQQIEIAHAYEKYQELLAKAGLLDFGNQIYLALVMLRKFPSVLNKYQNQFKYILLDEFQDTNFAQYQLARILAQKRKNITVTGDDDQCIYRFRGAAYSNLLNFIKDFPKAEKISITKNYRSVQPILDHAYRLIQFNNPERFEVKAHIDKRLIAENKEGDLPLHLHFDSNTTESDKVASIIKEKVLSGKYSYRDFAILVRSNSDAKPYLQSMNMQDIPWQFSGNQGLYSREEVKLCINFLRCMANISDSLSLFYLASCQIYNLSLTDLSLCSHYAKRRNKSLYLIFRDLEKLEELKEITEDSRKIINNILFDIDKFLAVSRNDTTGRLLYSFLTETGFLKNLTANQSLENETKIQNLAKFFNIVRDFELVAKEDRVITFVEYLNLMMEAGDDPPTVEADFDTDAVNVLTIHKAKGLEFKVVFMVSLVQGKFPWPKRSRFFELPDALIKEELPTGDFHIQEERRLFYVGLTRAKEELYLTSASDYGGLRAKKVSQFVLEALGKESINEEKKKASAIEAISRFAPTKDSVKIKKNEDSQKENRSINLSYYQIDDYITCPLKYKFVNILRVPILEHHTVIYGRAMHEAVSRYYQVKLSGEKIEAVDLISFFQESFDPQGFLVEKHQEERFTVGKEALIKFYQTQEKNGNLPKFIEKDFSFVFENNRISGRFDRIDEEKDGIVIMDFKTSQIKEQKDADKRVKESDQLALYALAYKDIFGVLPVRVKLYFLESGVIGSTEVTTKMLERVQEDMRRASSGIKKHSFEAKPDYINCSYCAYNQICSYSVAK